jgi:hypothetical protein
MAPFGAAVKARVVVGRTANKNAAYESFIVVFPKGKVSDRSDTIYDVLVRNEKDRRFAESPWPSTSKAKQSKAKKGSSCLCESAGGDPDVEVGRS